MTPALSAEEWARVLTEPGGAASCASRVSAILDGGPSWSTNKPTPESERTASHALAALALHGQPFGFTREDVIELNWVADHLEEEYSTPIEPSVMAIRQLRDRIAALLPPVAE